MVCYRCEVAGVLILLSFEDLSEETMLYISFD